MAKAQNRRSNFIDLYKVLNLPRDADIETIRERIHLLYFESQENLDHRNRRKRNYYVNLYEDLLPKARYVFSDDDRRARYDQKLIDFDSSAKTTSAREPDNESSSLSSYSTTQMEQGRDAEIGWDFSEVDRDADEDKEVPQSALIQTENPLDVESASSNSRSEQPEQKHPFNAAALHPDDMNGTAEQRAKIERRRLKIIRRRANDAMLSQGIMVGVSVFVASLVILYFMAGDYLSGSFAKIVFFGWIVIAVSAGFISGWFAAQSARRNTIIQLSKSSYKELKRR